MIEREFVKQKLKEFEIREYLEKNLKRVGYSTTKIKRSPLGDKVIIYASRPGLIIGRQGANIKTLTKALKNRFKLENPQIEIEEIKKIYEDAQIVAEEIANNLERYGPQRFKGIGHRVMTRVLETGSLGVEILISGKIPSSRSKTWRFYAGYLKKCGDIAVSYVKKAYATAELKTGTVGIIVKIMPSNIRLPYDIRLIGEPDEEVIEEVIEEKEVEKVEEEIKSVAEKQEEATKEEVEKITEKEEKKVVKKVAKPKKETKKKAEEKKPATKKKTASSSKKKKED
ncbi:30S ribosomal protein S3 [Candidatus Woesearchaeota archaeon]|nr:30S ribosomal protein S3 [Candidatus Woesearchaeota archaeon]